VRDWTVSTVRLCRDLINLASCWRSPHPIPIASLAEPRGNVRYAGEELRCRRVASRH